MEIIKEIASWEYTDKAYIGITINDPDGKPLDDEQLAEIDTGFSGDIILPFKMFNKYNLNRWETPLPIFGSTVEKREIPFIVASTKISIPKANLTFDVRISTFEEDRDECGHEECEEFLVGIKLLKKLRILLDSEKERVRLIN